MAQRNPMNDRYQSEDHRGKTRKSAASAKPKSQAASSVYVRSKTKTKAEKKAIRRAERQKQAELDRKYSNPPTPEYRRLRRIWWVLLVAAIVLMIISFSLQNAIGEVASFILMVPAYICIIAALWLEFSKMKRLRLAYQAEMQAHKSKSRRAQEKAEKAAARAAKQEAEQKYEETKRTEQEKKAKGFFGRFGSKKSAETEAGQENGAGERT